MPRDPTSLSRLNAREIDPRRRPRLMWQLGFEIAFREAATSPSMALIHRKPKWSSGNYCLLRPRSSCGWRHDPAIKFSSGRRAHPVFSNVGQTESLRTAIADRPELCSMRFISTIRISASIHVRTSAFAAIAISQSDEIAMRLNDKFDTRFQGVIVQLLHFDTGFVLALC